MESPVCTPIGSKFSIAHTTTQLSALSLITSNSYSFQPFIDCSIRISWIGLAARPLEARVLKSSGVSAIGTGKVHGTMLNSDVPDSSGTLALTGDILAFAVVFGG